MSMGSLLEMKGITKVYPNGVLANDGVDFSVRKGEIHALVGENGAEQDHADAGVVRLGDPR